MYILNHLKLPTKDKESKMHFQIFYMNDLRDICRDSCNYLESTSVFFVCHIETSALLTQTEHNRGIKIRTLFTYSLKDHSVYTVPIFPVPSKLQSSGTSGQGKVAQRKGPEGCRQWVWSEQGKDMA